MQNSILEYAAETHYFIRPYLNNSLKTYQILDEQFRNIHGVSNYYDFWIRRLSDKFFDMTTLIRVATSIETVLRDFYMSRRGYTNQIQLRSDPGYKVGVFQRIMPWHGNGAVQLFASVGVDLSSIPEWSLIQELMLHRHIYAHNAGLLDDKYIDDLKRLTGVDIMSNSNISASYPAHDTYYFEPLGRLTNFIEAARRFSNSLV